MLRVLSPTNQTCVASCVNADFWLDKMSRSHTIHGGAASLVAKQVCLGPLKRATCIDFVAKSRTSLYFLQQLSTTFQDRFDSWVVKRATSLLNSFCSKVSKQVTRFSCSFCFAVPLEADLSKYSHHCEAQSRKLRRLPSSVCYRGYC